MSAAPPAGDERGRRSVAVVRLGPWAVVLAVVVSVLLVGVSWTVPAWTPADVGDRDDLRVLVARAFRVEAPRSLVSWWTTVLPLLAAAACWTRGAGAAVGPGADAGSGADEPAPGASRAAGAGWRLLAVVMAGLSVDHALGSHRAGLSVEVLPGPLAEWPTVAALAAVAAPAGLLLLAAGSASTRVLLPLAATAYLAGAVLVGGGRAALPLGPHRTSLLEQALEWTGLLLVLLAATRAAPSAPPSRAPSAPTADRPSHPRSRPTASAPTIAAGAPDRATTTDADGRPRPSPREEPAPW